MFAEGAVRENEKTIISTPERMIGIDNESFQIDEFPSMNNPSDPPVKPQQLQTPEDENNDEKLEFTPREKWRILKNIVFVSAAFMIQFTAFQGTANLQSSINSADGLGIVSLCSIYAALVVSCIFVPTIMIKRLTAKWTLCISMLCYAPYIASQFYPKFYTLVPSGIILGIGAAPMWAAKATYLTQAGSVYAKLTDQAIDAIIVRFFGFFFFAWQTAELWGNLISSLVLSSGAHGQRSSKSLLDNSSLSEIAFSVCGANFCTEANHENENLERPPDAEIYEISAIYLSCVLLATAMMAFFVDPLSRYGERQRKSDQQQPKPIELLSATCYQLKKHNQQLLIPITLWIGVEQAFIGADFTQAYVSCALGIHTIGYVMICFGVVNAICSVLFGSLMKFVGRAPLMVLGFIVHVSLITVLLLWRPHPNHSYAFYLISGMWGVGDAVWQTQVNGIYGTLFRRNKEAAFSNYRLWESAGFVIAYAFSTNMCVRMKLYVMLANLSIGFAGYVFVEFLHKRKVLRLKAKEQQDQNGVDIVMRENCTEEEIDDETDDIDNNIIITRL